MAEIIIDGIRLEVPEHKCVLECALPVSYTHLAGSEKKSPSNVPVVTRPCTIQGMPWIFDAPIQSTGSSIKWFIDKMAAQEKLEAKEKQMDIYTYLNELASEAQPGAGGLFFYPYLMGERAPLWNEYARGMFIGMGMDTERRDFVRAVFEGTAYALRHVVETIKKSGARVDALYILSLIHI